MVGSNDELKMVELETVEDVRRRTEDVRLAANQMESRNFGNRE